MSNAFAALAAAGAPARRAPPALAEHRVLLVEDNPGDADLACERLGHAPSAALHVEVASTLAQALRALAATPVEAILVDLNLPDSQGLETLRRIRAAAADTPIIVLTGHVDPGLRASALHEGAEDVFTKSEANSRLFCRCVLYEIEHHRARAQHRRLEGLLAAMPDAILVVNRAGIVQFVNQAALALFDCPREHLEDECLSFSAAAGETVEIVVPRAGDVRACEMRVVPLDWDGEPAHLACIRDITMRRQSEALRARGAELERLNERKSEFLANISHEIRTPMNAIIGLTHLLGQTRLDAEQSELLAQVRVASRSLMGLISDVLDLSKIEAGEVVLEDIPFELAELLHELRQMIAPLLCHKPVDLVVQAVSDLPPVLRGDVTRLRQILVNLLGNAVKFTERGRVSLAVESRPGEDGRAALEFVVTDTGIGMDSDALERIFMPFTQADASTTRRFGGSGLGLSIVRQLVQLMGGEVKVRSEPGRGSEFRVVLPLAIAAEVADPGDGAASALRVLVLEAPERGATGLAALAGTLGWSAERVDSAAQLVARLQALLQQDRRPDAVVIDAVAGHGAGLAPLRALKQAAGLHGLPPLLWALPHAAPDDSKGAPDAHYLAVAARDAFADSVPAPDSVADAVPAPDALAGTMAAPDALADAVLTPPATAAALFNAVNGALMARGSGCDRLNQLTRLDAAGACCLDGVRVLVVDDCAINRDIARRLLEREGARVTTLPNGRRAVQALGEGLAADIVLMDVQMPEMDGPSAARALRTTPGLQQIPIVALTAGALRAERERALAAGMDDFISKPLDPLALVRALRRHVERATGRPLALRPRATVPDPAALPWPALAGIDLQEVALRLQGDMALFATQLERLLCEVDELSEAPAPAPWGDARRAPLRARMHRLRGTAGMLGAVELRRHAGAVEDLAASRAPDAALEAALAGLRASLRALRTHALPWLQARQADASAAPNAPAPAVTAATASSVAPLLELLRTQDLAARRHFAELAPALSVRLGPARHAQLCQAMARLDFAAAADLIDSAVPVA